MTYLDCWIINARLALAAMPKPWPRDRKPAANAAQTHRSNVATFRRRLDSISRNDTFHLEGHDDET